MICILLLCYVQYVFGACSFFFVCAHSADTFAFAMFGEYFNHFAQFHELNNEKLKMERRGG